MKDFPIKSLEALTIQISQDINFEMREMISNFLTAMYVERGKDKLRFEENVNYKIIDLIDKIFQKTQEIKSLKGYKNAETFLDKRIQFLDQLIFDKFSIVNNLSIFCATKKLIDKKIILNNYQNNLQLNSSTPESNEYIAVQDEQIIADNFDNSSLSKKLKMQTKYVRYQFASQA